MSEFQELYTQARSTNAPPSRTEPIGMPAVSWPNGFGIACVASLPSIQ
jgi:hypothetical protein